MCSLSLEMAIVGGRGSQSAAVKPGLRGAFFCFSGCLFPDIYLSNVALAHENDGVKSFNFMTQQRRGRRRDRVSGSGAKKLR